MNDELSPYILSAAEEDVSEQIKTGLYYDGANEETLVASLSEERKEIVIDSTISAVSFEQELRRRFILRSVAGDYKQYDQADSLTIINSLANGNFPATANSLGQTNQAAPDSNITSPDPEVTSEARIYIRVEKNLDTLRGRLLYKKRDRLIYNILAVLSVDKLAELAKAIDGYISQVKEKWTDAIATNPEFTPGLKVLLRDVGLPSVANNSLEIGAKINTLTEIKTYAEAIIANHNLAKPLSNEELLDHLSLLDSLQG